MPETQLVLGKHSGRHALAKRCEDLGCPLTREQLDTMYHRFTALADRKKGLRNDEIAALAREVLQETQATRRSRQDWSRLQPRRLQSRSTTNRHES